MGIVTQETKNAYGVTIPFCVVFLQNIYVCILAV